MGGGKRPAFIHRHRVEGWMRPRYSQTSFRLNRSVDIAIAPLAAAQPQLGLTPARAGALRTVVCVGALVLSDASQGWPLCVCALKAINCVLSNALCVCVGAKPVRPHRDGRTIPRRGQVLRVGGLKVADRHP
jgi:hypothetical protein